jgi:hypothetical protein
VVQLVNVVLVESEPEPPGGWERAALVGAVAGRIVEAVDLVVRIVV